MSGRPLVLLLRAPAEPDPYAEALSAAGFDAVSFPVLRFDLVNGGELARRLTRSERYGGLVLTSPRAVEALAQHPRALGRWREKPVYAVGPATAGALRALGLRPVGEEAGEGGGLATRIAEVERWGGGEKRNTVPGEEEGPPPRPVPPPPLHRSPPLLFLCGNRRRDTLPDYLAAAGVPLEELTVYHTTPIPPALPPGLDPDWAVFFSPTGVEAAAAAAGFPWNRLRTGAIGPTTAEALRALGRPPAAVAAEPTPGALTAALARAAA